MNHSRIPNDFCWKSYLQLNQDLHQNSSEENAKTHYELYGFFENRIYKKIKIAFVGNCQMVSLCYFLQQLLGLQLFDIKWINYNDAFATHLHSWSDKCLHKILNANEGIEFLKNCDSIIYQNIKRETSPFFNSENIFSYKKKECLLISITSIHLDINSYDESINKLKEIDDNNNNTIKVSRIIEKYYPHHKLLLSLSLNHPSTFLFLEILREICSIMNIPFFKENVYNTFCRNSNFMDLP